MVLLEDQHRAQAHGVLAASTDVDADLLGVLQELISARAVECDEGALALATQVLDLVGVFLGERSNAGVQVVTDVLGVVHQVQALDLLDDGTEEDGSGWVSHPGVELAVGLVWSEFRVAVVVAGSLGLLGEGHDIRRGL